MASAIDTRAIERAMLEMAKLHGIRIAEDYDRMVLRRVAERDELEFRAKLDPLWIAHPISQRDMMLVGSRPAEVIRIIDDELATAAARLRAGMLMHIIDGDRPLDFTNFDNSENGSPYERMERIGTKLLAGAVKVR